MEYYFTELPLHIDVLYIIEGVSLKLVITDRIVGQIERVEKLIHMTLEYLKEAKLWQI